MPYDSTKDPLSKQYARAQAPGRYAYLATAAASELPVYGKPRIYNSNAAPATVTVVAAEEPTDTNTITLTVPPNSVVTEGLVVRRLTAIGTGVTVHILV